MMITNEWEHISEIRNAIGHQVLLLYPNAATADAQVYSDNAGDVQYELTREENYLMSPVFWRFKK